MGMSSDGSWLATYRDNAISLWDMKKKAKLKTYCNQDLGNIRSIAISNDGAYVAVPSEGWRKFPRGGVVLMNTETGWEEKDHSGSGQEHLARGGLKRNLQFTDDSEFLIAGDLRDHRRF